MNRKIFSIGFALIMLMAGVACLSSCKEDDTVYGTCTVSGKVLDADGHGIEGAVVKLMVTGEGRYAPETRTDESGAFTIHEPKATDILLLEVKAEGYQDYYGTITPPYQNPVPDESLGTATIVMQDIILVPDKK